MWTEITRPKYERAGLRYASDLTDREWEIIEPFLPPLQISFPLATPGASIHDNARRGHLETRATGEAHREPAGSMEEPASRLDRTAPGSGLHPSGPAPMAQASEPFVMKGGRLGSCFALPDQEMAPVARDGGTAERRKRDVCARTLSQTAPNGLCPQSKLANTPERPRNI